jgi:Flp pilus assembly pilin Flp
MTLQNAIQFGRGASAFAAHSVSGNETEVRGMARDIILRAQVRVQTALYSLRHRQEGQGLVEYGLIIASIAILLVVAMLFLAGKIDDLFSETGTSVESPGPLP